MLKKFRAGLELMRPANIVTAFADILAGFAAAGGIIFFTDGWLTASPEGLGWLLLSTFGLYGGGVVFNDVFDAKLDAKERPERPIPGGRISQPGAAFLGASLLAVGVLAAFQVNSSAGTIAAGITVCALFYDAIAKHSVVLGPLAMGLCRGGNLMLGCAIVPSIIVQLWFLALIPVVYIGSITLVSQGEVKGGSKQYGFMATGLIVLVIAALFFLALNPSFGLLHSLPFIILFAVMVLPVFISAANNPDPVHIRKAVRRGVLSLMLLNSALAAGFAGVTMGIIILLLFPFCIMISKMFAVT